MNISLSDHFTYRKLIAFVFPTICMMIFTSIYSIVDGFFVSNYVGKTALASVNLIMPFLMIVSSFGFMMATGANAIIGKTLGERKTKEANEYFSFIILFIFCIGLIVSVLGFIFMPWIVDFFKATPQMRLLTIIYGRIMMISSPFFMLQTSFQTLFVTAEKPKYGLYVTIGSGCANIVLDFLLVGYFHFGIAGAAIASASCEIAGGSIPVFYFFSKHNSSLLHFVKPKMKGNVLLKAMTNGSSEFVSNISSSLVAMVYNFQLLRLAGQNGIATMGAILYVNFIFVAIFMGYATGSAPLSSYNYGAQNEKELKNIFKKSCVCVISLGMFLTLVSLCFNSTLMKLFVGYDKELYSMACKAFRIYCFQYVFTGIAMYGSSFFTSLNNGKISALLSFLRCFVFQMGSLFLFPYLFGLDGIWMACIVAEICISILTVFCLFHYKNQYHFM